VFDQVLALPDARRAHERSGAQPRVRGLAIGGGPGRGHDDAEELHHHQLGVRPRAHHQAEVDVPREHHVAHRGGRAVPQRDLMAAAEAKAEEEEEEERRATPRGASAAMELGSLGANTGS